MSLYDEDEGSSSCERPERITHTVKRKYTRDRIVPQTVYENLDTHTAQWYA
jgi:hypothetical protein